MSLKAFHVFFVSVCVVLCLGVGIWAVGEYRRGLGSTNLVLAAGSLVVGAGLVIYGKWFLRKLKGVSYL